MLSGLRKELEIDLHIYVEVHKQDPAEQDCNFDVPLAQAVHVLETSRRQPPVTPMCHRFHHRWRLFSELMYSCFRSRMENLTGATFGALFDFSKQLLQLASFKGFN